MNGSWNILIVEDDEVLGRSLIQRFRLEGYAVRFAPSVEAAAIELRRGAPSFILTDIRLPDGSGEAVVKDAFEAYGVIPTIVMTAYGSIDQAIRLIKLGARDYIAKPFDLDELIAQVASLFSAMDPGGAGTGPFPTFGLSEPTRKLRSMLQRAARSDLPVLITGETGVGKEVAARLCHWHFFENEERPFVAVNCAAIPADLFESMVFGHERGSFTGAAAKQIGFVEAANAGTLFLDELGELPLAQQAKLLRLVETRTFQRVGSPEIRESNARIVLATNRDLAHHVSAGHFREDLFYRINAIECRVPPLRDRIEEILPIAEHQLERIALRTGQAALRISEQARLRLIQHAWPGNVRELMNRLERAVALAEGVVLGVTDLFPDDWNTPVASEPQDLSLAGARSSAERAQIELVLRLTDGGVSEAARKLGVSRTTLWNKMTAYGIEGSQRSGE